MFLAKQSAHVSAGLAGALDAVPAGLIVLNEAGHPLETNAAALDLLGCEAEAVAAALLGAGLCGAPAGAPAIRVAAPGERTVEATRRPLPSGGSIITLLDVTARVRAEEMAERDALTGLANRVALDRGLQEMLSPHSDHGGRLAVLCLDLDRFKAINDTQGHAMGDALLRKVADRLRGGVKAGDLVARIGGDEFTVIQSGAPTAEEAAALAERLVDLLGRTYAIGGQVVNIGASVGVALAPEDGATAQELLRRADLALYRAKAEGRGVWRRFKTGMDDQLRDRQALEFDLRKALAMRELSLEFQPQFDLSDHRLTGFEALLRWNHPRRGRVPPSTFIPLAEELGLIVPIGEWVLRRACRAAAGWPGSVRVAVNLSPVQLRSPRLVSSVRGALDEAGLEPSRLELEVTENTLVEDLAAAEFALGELRVLGVSLTLDDFGTGATSLAQLGRFRFDRIKVDRSFVNGEANPEASRAMFQAVGALSYGLGIPTVAEGVETAEQLARVRDGGCHEVQGFLTGRPMPEADAAALCARSNPSQPESLHDDRCAASTDLFQP